MQKTRLADPPSPVNEFRLHDRDLAARTAERNETEFQPEPERFSEAWVGGRFPSRS